MPDRKPVDLTQTAIEKETGILDPYAEAIRRAHQRSAQDRMDQEAAQAEDDPEASI